MAWFEILEQPLLVFVQRLGNTLILGRTLIQKLKKLWERRSRKTEAELRSNTSKRNRETRALQTTLKTVAAL